jgi:hypothetical protein
MNGHHSPGLGLGDDHVDIEIGAMILAEQKQLTSRGGEWGGFVDIGGRKHGHGIEDFTDGPHDTPGRDTPVGDKDLLAADLLGYLLKTLHDHLFTTPYIKVSRLSESFRTPAGPGQSPRFRSSDLHMSPQFHRHRQRYQWCRRVHRDSSG